MNDYGYDYQVALETCGIDPKDVDRVVHWFEGYNDGDSWMFVLVLKSGQWVYGEAWCDYTGWDCRAGGEAFYADSEETLARTGMTLAARREFGYGNDGYMEWV